MFSVLLADEIDFNRAGYPTIATVGGAFIFLYTIYYATTKTGFGGWRNHAVWFFFNLWLWLFGLFLVFGPDSLASLPNISIGGTTYQATAFGPRSAILGLQLMMQAAIGVFAIYSANAYASLVFAVIGLFNELGLIGSNFLFNYNQPIWTLDTVQCNLYFEQDPDANIERCKDDGYLEFLRVIGTLEIIVNGFLIVVALLAYATAVPAGYSGAAYPAGTTGGTSTYAPTTAGGYNAGPSYGTATAGPGFVSQGAGAQTSTVTTSTPYTSTTSAPYTTTAVPATGTQM